MVIVKTHGGLGNQFFQYAAGKALADFHHTEFKFEISPSERYSPSEYCLDKFLVSAPIATKEEVFEFTKNEQEITGLKKIFIERFNFLFPYFNFLLPYQQMKVYHERFYQYNKRFFDLPSDVYLVGYFQSERFFERVKDNIRKEFALKDQSGAAFNFFAEKIRNSNSTSIHFRRGDYITYSGLNKIFGVPSLKYYYDAVNELCLKVKNPVIYIFSNDIEWVKQNFNIQLPTVYVTDPSLKFYEEMTLMSFCRHNIIANSSFSWWGAWLNNNPDKIIIAPEKWFQWWKINTRDIIPSGWIKIPNL
jgi:hypothetical protein